MSSRARPHRGPGLGRRPSSPGSETTEVEVRFSIRAIAVSGLSLDDVALQFNAGTAPVITRVSGITASSASFGSAGIAVPGTGHEKFETDFVFPNAANRRVEFGKDSVYDITFSSNSPILAGDLSNLFKTPNASGHVYLAVAHLAGYGSRGAGLAGQIASAPEPIGAPLTGSSG